MKMREIKADVHRNRITNVGNSPSSASFRWSDTGEFWAN